MFDTRLLSGISTHLTKIFKNTRHFFNLSKIEGGDRFFSFCMGRRFNCRKGEKKGCKPYHKYFINMPPLSVRAKQAKQRRGNGNQRFSDLKNDFSSLPSEENLINPRTTALRLSTLHYQCVGITLKR